MPRTYLCPTPTTVSQYNEAGWLRDLPPLLQARDGHGCSYYNNNEGTKVCSIGIDIDFSPIIIFQTYLVTGGYYSGYFSRTDLSYTELLVETASAWVWTGSLPYGRSSLIGANIDNRILMIGN